MCCNCKHATEVAIDDILGTGGYPEEEDQCLDRDDDEN